MKGVDRDGIAGRVEQVAEHPAHQHVDAVRQVVEARLGRHQRLVEQLVLDQSQVIDVLGAVLLADHLDVPGVGEGAQLSNAEVGEDVVEDHTSISLVASHPPAGSA
jgi:hypothetical protein